MVGMAKKPATQKPSKDSKGSAGKPVPMKAPAYKAGGMVKGKKKC